MTPSQDVVSFWEQNEGISVNKLQKHNKKMGNGLEASGRGGTKPTPSVCGARPPWLSPSEESLRLLWLPVQPYQKIDKAIGRKTTGTGRKRYVRHVAVRFKFNFREGTEAAPRKKRGSASY